MSDLALHIPTDVVNGPTSLAFAAIAALAVGACVVMARRNLDERLVPLAGLATAFIFAAQMLNFPVAAGVSGHLLGGALAAALLGPWLGALCVTVVIVIQALLFADGAVTALGLNVVNMAVIASFTGYGVIALALKVLPRTRWGLGIAVFAAAVVGVVAASAGFVLQFWLGGEEVEPVLRRDDRRDPRHPCARGDRRRRDHRRGRHRGRGRPARPRPRPARHQAHPGHRHRQGRIVKGRRMKTTPIWIAGFLVTLVLAGVVSLFASASPDGLESVLLTGCDTADSEITGGTCVLQAAGDHEIGGAFADYGMSFLDNESSGPRSPGSSASY